MIFDVAWFSVTLLGTPNVWTKKENPRDAVRKEVKALLLLFLEAENPWLINVINPMQDEDINSNTYVLAN